MALITLRDANITQSKPGLPIPISKPKSRVPQYRPYFVGEMLRIGISRFYQTELLVTDEDGKLLRVAFAFPDDGKESGSVPTRYMKHGCAILILYATRVDMPGGGQGIEVHNPRHIKVGLVTSGSSLKGRLSDCVQLLNFTLSDFEWFIDMLHDARSVERRKRLCYGCGTRRYGLQRCPRCKLVYFCGPV
ncbi:hypothetical protein BDW62DRAFT_197916 [Aspergillus aurantiobrunneus]